MNDHPVRNCTFIIRTQAEYSPTSQRVVLRCILETPAKGQRQGFTDTDALLAAVRAKLEDLQSQTARHDQENPADE